MNDLPDYPLRDFKTAEDWHLYYVYNDKDFRIEALTANQTGEGWEEIEQKYCISDMDITFFIQGGFGDGFKDNAKLEKNMGYAYEDDGMITVQLMPYITHDQYLKIWSDVLALKTQLNHRKRRRPPENPSLIYAIFKCKKSHTFSEIFKYYAKGALLDYSGSTNQFKSEDSLERYYHKYRPDTTQPDT